jgi:hypothetical protein
MEYYVYVYLDVTQRVDIKYCDIFFEYRPIYIGKGKNKRMYNHFNDCKRYKNMFYNKLNKMINEENIPLVLKLKSFEFEKDALNFEKELIKSIGTIKVGGLLYNTTDGGIGFSGYQFTDDVKEKMRLYSIENKLYLNFPQNQKGENHPMWGKKHTADTKEKMSKSRNLRVTTDETKKKMSDSHKGKKLSENTKNKLRDINTGKKLSEETKDKISNSKKGKLSWNHGKSKDSIIQLDLNNNFLKEWNSLIDIQNAGYQKSNVINVCNGKRKSHGGYKWIYKNDFIDHYF